MTGYTVSVDQERIDITSGYPTVDPNWTATDANGHDHHYDNGYPTLELVVDQWHWCDGYEGAFAHDPHKQVDESHYECKVCREVVEPGMLPPFHPRQIPGNRTVTIEGVDVVAQPYGEPADDLMRRLSLTRDPAIHERIIGQFIEAHPEFITSRIFRGASA